MNNQKNIFIIVIVLLLLGANCFFAYSYFKSNKELKEIKSQQVKSELNTKVVDFASLFITKVLQADKEVDFETRLILENSVRDLKDDDIKREWQNFIASKTEVSAQESVKRLLGVLVSKIQK
jgi:Tfp pilus assembly protein PilO